MNRFALTCDRGRLWWFFWDGKVFFIYLDWESWVAGWAGHDEGSSEGVHLV